ncbi:hypothetical protein [Neotabrizicola shimadae]|uniref:Uncharacterized protein n=1 Tax=Neotabrizicola shimadae TaxID=2807096 RepID=A0A8G1EE42_9RHOB|nr:hypothetical protein [Neotabrizicola shimadae]QYZ70871.1 hypothetical protein JO391_04985 [Neotabrizicola shimadae]
MKTRILAALLLTPMLALPALAMDPDPTTFTCSQWWDSNESVQIAFLRNAKAWATDAANAPNTAKLQAAILSLSDTDARNAINRACDGQDVNQVVIDLVNK